MWQDLVFIQNPTWGQEIHLSADVPGCCFESDVYLVTTVLLIRESFWVNVMWLCWRGRKKKKKEKKKKVGNIPLHIPQTSAVGRDLGSGRGCWTRGAVWGSPCRLCRPRLCLRLRLPNPPPTVRPAGTSHLTVGTQGQRRGAGGWVR